MTLRITWVHEPKHLTPPPPGTRLSIGPEVYAPFISELERLTNAKINVATGLLHEVAPREGIIMFQPRRDLSVSINGCLTDIRSDVASRSLAVFAASPMTYLEKATEELGLGGVINSRSVDAWQRNVDAVTPGEPDLFARKDLGERIGATCLQPPKSPYCRFGSSGHGGLPKLVAAYIRVLADSHE